MGDFIGNFQGYLQLNIPNIRWILVFAFIFVALFYLLQVKGYGKQMKSRVASILCWGLLSLNCSFIYIMTLSGRRIGKTHRIALKPFSSYYVAFTEGNMEILLQILVNIAMYIPLGFLLPYCFKLFEKHRYVIVGTFCGSLIIELIQLIFRMGLFEVDDVINNTLGAVIGLLIYMIFKRGKNEHNKQKIS
jgi:glycopeptide antibiotics resistance protein